MYNIEIWPRAA